MDEDERGGGRGAVAPNRKLNFVGLVNLVRGVFDVSKTTLLFLFLLCCGGFRTSSTLGTGRRRRKKGGKRRKRKTRKRRRRRRRKKRRGGRGVACIEALHFEDSSHIVRRVCYEL